jgi:tRNA threonylcarbamoyladenosine biosynthesis protein TsaB
MQDLLVLGIETSGALCSVAWFRNNCILLEYNIQGANIHAALLAKLVQNGCNDLGIVPSEIGLVTVTTGPGSFTGLRIGMSYAKGLCYGLQKPIKGISNFEVLAESAPLNFKRLVTMVDARRNNYYIALFPDGNKQMECKKLIAKDELGQYLTKDTIIVSNQPVNDVEALIIHGRYGAGVTCKIGLQSYIAKGKDSLADLEPLYLQSFAGVA